MPILRRTKTRTICRVRPVPKRKRGAQFERSSFFIACFPSVFRTGAWVALAGGVRVSGASFFVRLFKLRCGRFYGVWGVSRTFLFLMFFEPERGSLLRAEFGSLFTGGERRTEHRGVQPEAGRFGVRCATKKACGKIRTLFLGCRLRGLVGFGDFGGFGDGGGSVRGRFLNPASGRVGPAGILSLRHRRPHRASRRTRLCRARKSTGRF